MTSRRFKSVQEQPGSTGEAAPFPCWAPVTGGAGSISSWDFGVSFALSPQQVWGCPGSCRQLSWQCSSARLSTIIRVGDCMGSGTGTGRKAGSGGALEMTEDLDYSVKKKILKTHKASRRQLLPLPAHPALAQLLLGVILHLEGLRDPRACHPHRPLEPFPVTLRTLQSPCFSCGSCQGGG